MAKVRLVALAFALALALGVTAAHATQHTYFGPEGSQPYGVQFASGWNYPIANKAWRPVGAFETIYYTDDSTGWGYKRNADENPIVWPYSGGYAKSTCTYSDHDYQGYLYNVTCKYET